jgi:hypothetical protein
MSGTSVCGGGSNGGSEFQSDDGLTIAPDSLRELKGVGRRISPSLVDSFVDSFRMTGNPEVICSSVGLVPINALVSGDPILQVDRQVGHIVVGDRRG